MRGFPLKEPHGVTPAMMVVEFLIVAGISLIVTAVWDWLTDDDSD